MPNPPRPSALKKLAGTYRPDRAAPNEPTPDRGRPRPPKHLTPRAKKFWPDLVQLLDQMGVLTIADAIAVEGLAECYAELVDARAQLRKRGATTYETNGMVRAYPEVAQIADADRRLRGWLSVWGLTPADRVRVSAIGTAAETNPFADI